MTATQRKRERKTYIRRLNVLFSLGSKNPENLNETKFATLLDDLYFSFYSRKRDRAEKNHFNETADIKGVITAHRELKKHFEEDLDEFHLAETILKIHTYPEMDGFFHTVNSKDFPTEVYVTFANLLQQSEVKPGEGKRCSHCTTWFIPLRQPRKDEKAYCSRQCSNIVASRVYRSKDTAEAKEKAIRKAKKKKPK